METNVSWFCHWQHYNTHCRSTPDSSSWWGLNWTSFVFPWPFTPSLRTLGGERNHNTKLVTKKGVKCESILPLATLQYALSFSNQGFLLTGTQLDSFHIAEGIHARTLDPRERRNSWYSTCLKEPRQRWVQFVTGNITIRTVVQQAGVPPDWDSAGKLP